MDWLGSFVPRLQPRKQPLDSLAAPRQDDLDRLDELSREGSRLELPHPVRAFLEFPDEEHARQAMDMLRKDGYQAHLRAVAAGRWNVTAITSLVPTPGAITRLREIMSRVAEGFGGSYEGWGAPPVY